LSGLVLWMAIEQTGQEPTPRRDERCCLSQGLPYRNDTRRHVGCPTGMCLPAARRSAQQEHEFSSELGVRWGGPARMAYSIRRSEDGLGVKLEGWLAPREAGILLYKCGPLLRSGWASSIPCRHANGNSGRRGKSDCPGSGSARTTGVEQRPQRGRHEMQQPGLFQYPHHEYPQPPPRAQKGRKTEGAAAPELGVQRTCGPSTWLKCNRIGAMVKVSASGKGDSIHREVLVASH
jgi:hypothetical protein